MFKDCHSIEKREQSISVPEKGKDEEVKMESDGRTKGLEITRVADEE